MLCEIKFVRQSLTFRSFVCFIRSRFPLQVKPGCRSECVIRSLAQELLMSRPDRPGSVIFLR